MRYAIFLLSVLSGILMGLALTNLSVGAWSDLFVTHQRNWAFSPRIGAPDIDPYARARLFSEGELPLASGEGFTLRARFDDNGAVLDRLCSYRLSAPFPAARFWTLTLTDQSGRLVSNLAERHGFTSGEIVRSHDGAFAIEIAPDASAGNWLPTGAEPGRFELLLRFYETPLAATATQLDPRTLPRLQKTGCRA